MAHELELEQIDLATVTRQLRRRCGEVVVGFVEGRTVLRDALVDQLDCSQLEAEDLVETLIARGFVVRERSEEEPGVSQWRIQEENGD